MHRAFIELDPIATLIYAAVANGLIAPVILVLIVKISSNKKIMGERVNGRFTTLLGFLVTGIMALAGIATIISLIVG